MNVISTLHKLLESFISNYDSSSMYYVDFSKNKPKLNKYVYNYNNDTKFYIEYHKKYKSYLNDIFNYTRYGKDATEILSNYIELTGILKNNCINKIKNNLYILNTQFESELLKEPISPAEIRKLSIKNQNKIENENNRIKLIKLPYKILRDYKNLLLTYNLKEYSYTVRSAIEYINYNLQSNLSLSIISSYIGKNASFLSNQFKKETGVTITRYIQEKRVEESIRMLYSSDLSIGAMIFVISQLVDFAMEIGDIFLQGAKAQVLEQMAFVDDMTGVANRRRCEQMWDSLDQCKDNYGIFAFDLNFLKKMNDTKGHAMGDLLIRTFAKTLATVFDDYGTVGRIGGDEFVVFIPDMRKVNVQTLTQKLNIEIEKVNLQNPELNLSTAYGFCSHDDYPEYDSRKLYRRADEIMYENKLMMKAARVD